MELGQQPSINHYELNKAKNTTVSFYELSTKKRFTYLYLHRITQTGFKSQIPKTEFSRENPKKLKY